MTLSYHPGIHQETFVLRMIVKLYANNLAPLGESASQGDLEIDLST